MKSAFGVEHTTEISKTNKRILNSFKYLDKTGKREWVGWIPEKQIARNQRSWMARHKMSLVKGTGDNPISSIDMPVRAEGQNFVNTVDKKPWNGKGGIAKAQVSPGVFKPMSALKPLERAKVARRLKEGYHEGYGFKQKPGDSAGRRIWPGTGVKTPQGKTTYRNEVATSTSGGPEGVRGGTSIASAQPNGRGGGVIHLSPEARTRPEVVAHEMAHIAPRRNPYRFGERIRNNGARAREEGRADFIAHGRMTPRKYGNLDDREFQDSYNSVQFKMASARANKKRKLS